MMGFWEEVLFLSHLIKGHAIIVAYHCWGWPWSSGWYTGVLPCKVAAPPIQYCTPWGEVAIYNLLLRSGSFAPLPEDSVSTLNYLEFFHSGDLSLLPPFIYVFGHLFIWVWTHGYYIFMQLMNYSQQHVTLSPLLIEQKHSWGVGFQGVCVWKKLCSQRPSRSLK